MTYLYYTRMTRTEMTFIGQKVLITLGFSDVPAAVNDMIIYLTTWSHNCVNHGSCATLDSVDGPLENPLKLRSLCYLLSM